MKSNLVINPIYFFSLGFLYYLISPFLSFIFIDDFFQYTPLEASLKYINLEFFNIYYLLDLFLIYFSFCIGYKIGSMFEIRRNWIFFDKFTQDNKFNLIFVLLITTLITTLIITFLSNGNEFFSGYKEFNIQFLGQLSTLTVISVFLLNYTNIKKYKIFFSILLIIEFTLLLSLGSRNVAVNSFITILLGLLFYRSYLLYSPKFYLTVFIMIIGILYIGIWRTGYELKIQTLYGIFLSEPMFVLSSASVYIKEVGRETFNIPYEFFLAIINFIPTFLYEGKVDFIKSFMGYKYSYSPFGASSVIMNMYSNFGVLYFIYILMIGIYFNLLFRQAKKSHFFRSIYFLVVPLLIFQFYNQFLFAFFKLLFWNGLFLPILMVYTYKKIFNEYNN